MTKMKVTAAGKHIPGRCQYCIAVTYRAVPHHNMPHHTTLHHA